MTDAATLPMTLTPGAWPGHRHLQCGRAVAYLAERAGGGGTTAAAVARRAAVILNAPPGAPELERMLGIRLAVHLEHQAVKCRNRACRRRWTCLPEDPYYDATTAANGLCGRCVLAETRLDAAVRVIEPTRVRPPRKPRKPRPAGGQVPAEPDGNAPETPDIS
jgi:hypothetical protein